MKPGEVFEVETIVPAEGEYTLVAVHTFEGRQYVATVFVTGEVSAEEGNMVWREVLTAIKRVAEKP